MVEVFSVSWMIAVILLVFAFVVWYSHFLCMPSP